MSNNYKDNAQKNLDEYESALERFSERGDLKEKSQKKYEDILISLKERLKGYSHKDQKPYWTKDWNYLFNMNMKYKQFNK